MEYCCHIWAAAPSCYLELLDKLQKRLCRIVGPSLAASVEPLAHRWNVASSSLFYRYYFGRCSSELAQLVPLPFSRERSTRYSDRLHEYSVTGMSMSTVSFLTQLDSGILSNVYTEVSSSKTNEKCQWEMWMTMRMRMRMSLT